MYDINYYEDELALIENINSPEELTIELGGEIMLTRKYVKTISHQENSFTLHTHIKKGTKKNPN